MVKSGLVLCMAAPEEGEQTAAPGTDEQQDDQTGTDTTNAAANDHDQGGDADDEHVVVTIGEAPAPEDDEDGQPAAPWVKELRKENKEKARRIRELEQEKAERDAASFTKPAAVAKPTLADCEFDEEEFERKLTAWHDQQAIARAEQQAKVDAEKKQKDAWQATLANHDKAKAALKVPDYDEAEEVVQSTLSVTQRAIIVTGAANSALVEYALGKNPAKAKELAAIADPVKFAFAVANLESQLKITPRKTAPAPERQIRGNAAATAVADSKLASLEAEADRTNDRSKVIAYKRERRAA